MNNAQGWVKIHRQIKEWQHYQEPTVLLVFIDLLLSANTRKGWSKGIEVRNGELVTSVAEIMQSTGIKSNNTVIDALKKLEESGEIKRERCGKSTKIIINKFSKFQSGAKTAQETALKTAQETALKTAQETALKTAQETAQETALKTAQETALKTAQEQEYKEYKEEKEEKEEKETPSIACACVREEVGFEVFGEFGNVQLKPVERRAIVERYGEDAVNAAIADLSLKLADGSTQSINHYATLLYWLSCRKSNIGGAARFAKPEPQTDPRCETKEQRIKRLRDLWEQASEADRQSYLNTYNCYPWERED